MTDQTEKARAFAALHVKGDPLVLLNIWDAASARAVEAAGAPALATGSHALAEVLGHEDGERAPLADMVWMLERICKAIGLPVSHDTERGYGETPEAVAASCRAVIEAGAIGVNMEDSLDGPALRAMDEQAVRYRAAKDAMDAACPGAWLNARTDVFAVRSEASTADKIEEVAERGRAYGEAGADSLFVPFLRDVDVIAEVCRAVSLPVNVMRPLDGAPIAALAGAGAARISHGPMPWMAAMAALKSSAAELYR